MKNELAVLKWAMLRLEDRRRRWELQRCVASLGEVHDLLDTPDTPPFVWLPRGDTFHCLVALRGGVRTLFGHEYRHTEVCVWCGLQGGFTVPHLVRDCPHWETERRLTLLDIQNDLGKAGVKYTADCDSPCNRQLWYRFLCGASVPNSFVNLHLDAATHFARGSRAAQSAAMKPTLTHYRHAMRTAGKFMLVLVGATTLKLQQPDCAPPPQPQQRSKRLTINHFGRENIWLSTGATSWNQNTNNGVVLDDAAREVSALLQQSVEQRVADDDGGANEADILPYMTDAREYIQWSLRGSRL